MYLDNFLYRKRKTMFFFLLWHKKSSHRRDTEYSLCWHCCCCWDSGNTGAMQINRHLGSIVSDRAFITHCLSSQSVGNWVRSVLMMKWVSCIPLCSVCVTPEASGESRIAHLPLFTAPYHVAACINYAPAEQQQNQSSRGPARFIGSVCSSWKMHFISFALWFRLCANPLARIYFLAVDDAKSINTVSGVQNPLDCRSNWWLLVTKNMSWCSARNGNNEKW